jgi:hypothetical protein
MPPPRSPETTGSSTVRRCTQPEALRELVRRSRGAYTLLLHADVILLASEWLQRCTA